MFVCFSDVSDLVLLVSNIHINDVPGALSPLGTNRGLELNDEDWTTT